MNSFLISGIFIFVYFCVFFLIGQKIKNNSIVDTAWGLGFVLTAWLNAIVFGLNTLDKVVILILVSIWGLRLSYYIFKRNYKKPEDFRYQAMRNKWKGSKALNAFVKVYLLQAVIMFIVAMPILIIFNSGFGGISALSIIAIMIWITGFIFESVADMQLKKFVKNPNNKGKILKSGVWAYSRHPNYFGEAVMWWAIGLLAISHPLGFVAVISPVVITYLLVFVSGVPLLEKKYANNLEYQEYAKHTSIFIPLPKRK